MFFMLFTLEDPIFVEGQTRSKEDYVALYPKRAWGQDRCYKEVGSLTCSRGAGHDGMHAAYCYSPDVTSREDDILAAWDEDTCVEF